MFSICFDVFSICPGCFFCLTDLDNRQMDGHIGFLGMFFRYFMYLRLPMNRVRFGGAQLVMYLVY